MSDKNQDEDNAIFELLNGKSSWGVADLILFFGVERTTLWRWRKKGKLPEPTFFMGPKSAFWDKDHVINTPIAKHRSPFANKFKDIKNGV